MQLYDFKRVTVVAEAVLETRLTADLERLGASGWTILDARGAGSRGVRGDGIEGRNVQIETIVAESLAERILEHIASVYFRDFAVIAYADTVQVVRGSKYARTP
jgi:nitrogen regulatory protein P-II 2